MRPLSHAAMILSFDVTPDARAEHDHWHTHEHLIERLSIPGFLRGSRWVSASREAGYLVIYEVSDITVLKSAPYLERLNDPTPWTAKMMPHYRNMRRGFCALEFSAGHGMGSSAHVARFSPRAGAEASLNQWLVREALPGLSAEPGLAAASLFRSALTPDITAEQRIRSQDAGLDHVVIVSGYDPQRTLHAAANALSSARFDEHGACDHTAEQFTLAHSLTAEDLRG